MVGAFWGSGPFQETSADTSHVRNFILHVYPPLIIQFGTNMLPVLLESLPGQGSLVGPWASWVLL